MSDNIGKIQLAPLVEEMRRSYLDYAMSVIVARALPDVRDGLKPVHRRIIYAMHQMGYHHSGRFQKCASVVGETMKNYHPHGDIPIYDALVRMAQDFSMRNMLIEPQGNFGCFTKDTKVKLTDGRDLSFEELVEEHKQEKKNFTYTVNSLGLISIAEIKDPRKTITNAELVKVTLDNGEVIRCTPNHRFLLKNGTYKEAQYLTVTDSLMPLYLKISEKTDRLNRDGYLLIYQNKKNEWVPAHHLSDNYNLTNKVYRKADGRVRHHRDFNKNNNDPSNIVRLNWGEHWQIHHQHASEQHLNPEYREKISQGRRNYWDKPGSREKQALRMSQGNLENWQDPKYKEQMRSFLSQVNINYIQNHPEKRKELSERAHKTLKRLWQDPKYRTQMHENIIRGNKNHTTNKTGKVKFVKICQEIISQHSIINERHYSQTRKVLYPSGAAPHWSTGLNNYFSGNADLVRHEISGNHKIISVEHITEREDVYDLTIEKSHNFALASGIFVHNSVDGDPPAAPRYTECRLSTLSDDLLRDINKDTVDFVENYSSTTTEPVLLPSAIPNLLVNGASGIAVGMATQIPTHNLGEVCDALVHMIDKYQKAKDDKSEIDFESDATIEELMRFIKGPDFPTGATIYDQAEIMQGYATGKGRIVMRAKAEIDETSSGKMQIIVSEIPYQVNKATLIARIADLVKDKKLEGIADLRDESDRRQTVRVVVDLKRDAKPQSVLNNLYKFTSMQSVFNMNMVALVDGVEPQLLTLKRILEEFVKHRQTIIRRRSEFELREARAREHILEGLKIAVDNIDEVIATIRKSKDSDEAKKNLIAKFKLSELQATAILDMQLRRLAALERQKIEDELKAVREQIGFLEDLLAHPEKILGVVKDELLKVKEKYADERRTKVYKQKVGEFSEEDLVANEVTIVTITDGGYIKRQSPLTFRTQARGGKGVMGISTKETDAVSHIFYTQTHDNILFFTDRGRVFQLKVWEIPETQRAAKGQAIVNLINVDSGEKVTAVLTSRVKQEEAKFFFMCTKMGTVKKTPLAEYANIRKNGLVAIKLDKEDVLGWVNPTSGSDEIIIVSKRGQSIRFSEAQVKPTHRDTSGVRGIKLGKDDEVVALNKIVDPNDEVLVITENGLGKKTKVSAWTKQGRGGQGVKAAQITNKTGRIVTAEIVDKSTDTLVLTSNKGQLIKMDLKQVPTLQRQTQGVILMRVREGETVAAATTVSSKDKVDQKEKAAEE